MHSIGLALERHKGFGPGFDFLRLALSLSVLWFHSYVITGTMHQLESSPLWFYVYSIMPMFFALSGFLIAGSAERLNLNNFLINRGLRIVPALAVEIIISALIIGPIFTVWALSDYFSSPVFWQYFSNIIGWVHYELPGVFLDVPSAGVVNQSLWTVPFEVGCYVLISGVIIFRLSSKPWLILAFASALLILPVLFQAAGCVGENGKTQYRLLNYALFSRGAVLFPSFLLGAVFYWLRHKTPLSKPLLILCVLGCVVLAVLGNPQWKSYYGLNLIAIPLLTYITVVIGTFSIPKIPLYSKGDYSYGIYLYGYPLQQVIVTVLPTITFWLPHFLLSLVLVTAAAAFSWHCIEKPILKQRKKFSFSARRMEENQ
jgi:peptidoglycan/LPS O-acetylase OafA/YrhL